MLTFLFLLLLIFIFDRKREDLDAFSIAAAVVAPVIVTFFFRLIAGFLGWGLWSIYAEVGLFMVVTYLVLTRILAFKPRRAAAYATAVMVFNIAVFVGLAFFAAEA